MHNYKDLMTLEEQRRLAEVRQERIREWAEQEELGETVVSMETLRRAEAAIERLIETLIEPNAVGRGNRRRK